MIQIKTDFHLHAIGDPEDHFISHSGKELIDVAAIKNYKCMSITNHNHVLFSEDLKEYAQSKNILLIPGTEKTIEGKHVLLINFKNPLDIKNFKDLLNHKNENNLVIAAHPFFPAFYSLGSKLEQNIKCFDAIEYCHFHTKNINIYNQKAQKIAQKYNLPMVGNSDTHSIKLQFGNTFSLVTLQSDNITIENVIHAIKQKKVEVYSNPLTMFRLIIIFFQFLSPHSLKKRIKGAFKFFLK